MTTTWILVANATNARVFTSPKAKLLNGSCKLTLVNELVHPTSRMKTADLTTDDSGHNNFVESGNPKEYEMERFAKQLADMLDTGRNQHHYGELIIAAPPRFHGLLKKYLNNHVSNLVRVSIEKDYTQDKEDTLLTHLQE